MREEEEEGEDGEGTLLLRGGGGAVREAKGPRDGFGVFSPIRTARRGRRADEHDKRCEIVALVWRFWC
jgi:hypothetical protein